MHSFGTVLRSPVWKRLFLSAFPPLPIATLPPVIAVRHTQIFRVGMFRCGLYIFPTQKSSVVSCPRWTFEASHEARRRMAVYTRQQAGNRTRPASRGTRRATAVTPQPALMSHDCPARIARSPGCRALALLPEGAVRVAGHAPVATRAQTDGAYLGAVGNAVALELLLEKAA